MSKTCEKCGRRMRSQGVAPRPIRRKDPVTGFTCRFCSDECARSWGDERARLLASAVPADATAPPAESVP